MWEKSLLHHPIVSNSTGPLPLGMPDLRDLRIITQLTRRSHSLDGSQSPITRVHRRRKQGETVVDSRQVIRGGGGEVGGRTGNGCAHWWWWWWQMKVIVAIRGLGRSTNGQS